MVVEARDAKKPGVFAGNIPRLRTFTHFGTGVAKHETAMIESLFSNPSYAASKVLLDATAERHEALAANIANVETPGYKRVDLSKSFSEAFAAHVQSGTVSGMPAPSIEEDASATTMSQNGNNVQMDKELMEMSSNTLQYDTLTEFVSGSLKQLQMAITGRSS
jgi:flagellar basal-body rod protein FlgB